MRSSTIVFLIVLGMFLASLTIMSSCLGTVFMFTRSKEQKEESPRRPDTVDVPVAGQEIPAGALLTQPEKLFGHKTYPKGAEPPEAIVDLEHLRNRILAKKLVMGQHCLPSDLSIDDAYLLVLPPELRLMGIRVITDDGGNFVVPGVRADILVRQKIEDKQQHKVLMHNILLLAVNRPPSGAQPAVGEETKGQDTILSVSVAVTAEQGEKLADALIDGPLRLLVRPLEPPRGK